MTAIGLLGGGAAAGGLAGMGPAAGGGGAIGAATGGGAAASGLGAGAAGFGASATAGNQMQKPQEIASSNENHFKVGNFNSVMPRAR